MKSGHRWIHEYLTLSMLVLLVFFAVPRILLRAAEKESSVIARASHVPQSPKSGDKVVIRFKPGAPAKSVEVEFQTVDPGSYVTLKDPAFKSGWTSRAMQSGAEGPGQEFSVEIPGNIQTHRRLVRYRFKILSPDGKTMAFPPEESPEPNLAYFVLDGIPSWNAAIDPTGSTALLKDKVTFPPSVMSQIQSYHFVAKQKEIENATWYQPGPEKEYLFTGTFVADGIVYDHVRFRPRGGVWRHAMGKNMWKFDFNKGHRLQARDDYGRPYAVPWSKLNLRACIQQGDYGRRGEQGMYEAVGFRLFNLAGVPAPMTHWVSLRIVGEREENPADQYRGDFWGLYLAIENEDGSFLKQHKLPDGNLFKMMGGQGEPANFGMNQVTNSSDINKLIADLNGRSSTEEWCRKNLNLSNYYSYRSIVEAIHHYDISDGKNYDLFRDPVTGKWLTVPWDIDLTWGDHMYGGGQDPFMFPVLAHENLQMEYHNRLREIRDLLYNPAAMGRLINECASIISSTDGGPSIVQADRAKWDYHPIMNSRFVIPDKAGKGKFYEAVDSRDFAGMVRQMKDYVTQRSVFIDRQILKDSALPSTPTIQYAGQSGYPASGLVFSCSPYAGLKPFAAMQWRIGEEAMAGYEGSRPVRPGVYEIVPVWESGESNVFNAQVRPPVENLKPGHVYRARVRMKDNSGRWSHWSAPLQFACGDAKPAPAAASRQSE